MIAAATANGSAMWYLSRGTGVVSLLLLTTSVALGIVDVRRWRAEGWPRFVVDQLHRNASLLVVVFLGLHILTSVLDRFAPISLRDAVIPFAGTYRPLWLGFGALAFDLLLALVITSLLRSRIGFRGWRAVHWLAYACWPVALVHGLGTGSDAKRGWMLAMVGLCVATVWFAVWLRVAASSPERPGRRTLAGAAVIAAPLALVIWLPIGPLGSGWARRSGTPATLLAKARGGAVAQAAPGAAPAPSASGDSLRRGFTAQLNGTIGQSPAGEGNLVAINIPMTMQGGAAGRLDIRIVGEASPGGGVSMRESRVTMGPEGDPQLYSGQVVSLNGGDVEVSLSARDGRALHVRALLQIDDQASTVSGRVEAQPA